MYSDCTQICLPFYTPALYRKNIIGHENQAEKKKYGGTRRLEKNMTD